MNITKILTLLIALLVFIGAGVGFYILFLPKETSIQAPATDSNTNNPGGSSPAVTTRTQVQTSANPDIDTAFMQLFNKIGAQKVQFNSVTSITGDAGSVYSLYSSDIADTKKSFPKLVTFPISIALVDLNKDGATEAIAWEDLPGMCGSGGCPLDIYRKVNGKWVDIFSDLSGSNIGISSAYTNGYADLILAGSGQVDYQSKITRYSWDGTQYSPNGVVATWDGSQFNQ